MSSCGNYHNSWKLSSCHRALACTFSLDILLCRKVRFIYGGYAFRFSIHTWDAHVNLSISTFALYWLLVTCFQNRSKRLGWILKILVLFLLPIPLILWPVIAIIGSILGGIGYGFFAPLIATFEAVGEKVTDKWYHCFLVSLQFVFDFFLFFLEKGLSFIRSLLHMSSKLHDSLWNFHFFFSRGKTAVCNMLLCGLRELLSQLMVFVRTALSTRNKYIG